MLMKCVLDFADEEKMGRCGLVASQMASGVGFYEKFGFRVIKKFEFVDEDQFSGRKGTPGWFMVRDS